jgi:monovalent cation/hydrogen antiporter
VWIGLAAAAVAVVLRMMFVAPLVGVLRRDAARAVSARPELEKMQSRVADPELLGRFSARRVEHIGQRITRLLADVDFLVAEGFGWRGGVVLAWSGMRGVVTVAAAQSLPDDTPYRPQLVLIAFVVAATTLLVQGLTLPRVIRALKISGDDATADRAEYRELVTDLTETARAVLDDPDLCLPDGSPYPAAVLDRARQDALVPPRRPGRRGGPRPRDQYRQLMLQLLAAERAQLLAAGPDLVTCGIGVNDILYTGPGRLFSDLRALIAAVPDRTVLLDLPLPAGCWGFWAGPASPT